MLFKLRNIENPLGETSTFLYNAATSFYAKSWCRLKQCNHEIDAFTPETVFVKNIYICIVKWSDF